MGQVPIDIGHADFFINGVPVPRSGSCITTLAPQQECVFVLPAQSATFVAGAAYPFKIVTPSGGQFSYTMICGGASGQSITAITASQSSYTQIQPTNAFTTQTIVQSQVSLQTQPGRGDFFVNNAFLMIGAVAMAILLIGAILGLHALSVAHRNRDRGLYN